MFWLCKAVKYCERASKKSCFKSERYATPVGLVNPDLNGSLDLNILLVKHRNGFVTLTSAADKIDICHLYRDGCALSDMAPKASHASRMFFNHGVEFHWQLSTTEWSPIRVMVSDRVNRLNSRLNLTWNSCLIFTAPYSANVHI